MSLAVQNMRVIQLAWHRQATNASLMRAVDVWHTRIAEY